MHTFISSDTCHFSWHVTKMCDVYLVLAESLNLVNFKLHRKGEKCMRSQSSTKCSFYFYFYSYTIYAIKCILYK